MSHEMNICRYSRVNKYRSGFPCFCSTDIMHGSGVLHLFHLHSFVLFSFLFLPFLFIPLLEALGPVSFMGLRLLHGSAKKSLWSCRNSEMSCIIRVKQIPWPRERKVEFWWIGSGAIFAPPNSTQRVRSRRQRQLDGRCRALLGRFLAAEILPPRAFVSLKLPQLKAFSGDACIHIWPLLPCKILWQTKNLNKIKTMKNQHICLASCDPSRGMQSKNPGGQDPEAEPRMRQKKIIGHSNLQLQKLTSNPPSNLQSSL